MNKNIILLYLALSSSLVIDRALGSEEQPLTQKEASSFSRIFPSAAKDSISEQSSSSVSSWFNNEALQIELDRRTHSNAYHGNKVSLLVNGVQSLPLRKANLATADVIMIKVYEWHDSESSVLELLDILRARASEAKIFIQFDAKGSWGTAAQIYGILYGQMNPIPSNLGKLKSDYPDNVFILPTSIPVKFSEYLEAKLGIDCPIDHEKYFITWNSRNSQAPVKLIMGGMNMGDQYLLGATKDAKGDFLRLPEYNNTFSYRDTDVEVVGPVVQDIVKTFLDRFTYHLSSQNAYFKKNILPTLDKAPPQLGSIYDKMLKSKPFTFPKDAGGAFIRFVSNAPNQAVTGQHNIQETFSMLMGAIPSGKTVRMAAWTFYPTTSILSAMQSAAERGVQFNVLSNSIDAQDPATSTSMVPKCMRPYYPALIQKTPGLKIDEWHGDDTVMGVGDIHQKLRSFGEDPTDLSIVGSANMDAASLIHNSEGILLIQDPNFKKQFDTMFINDFNQNIVTSFTSEDAKNITYSQKIYAWFYSIFKTYL